MKITYPNNYYYTFGELKKCYNLGHCFIPETRIEIEILTIEINITKAK